MAVTYVNVVVSHV